MFGSLTYGSYFNNLELKGGIQPTDALTLSWKGLLGGLFGSLAFVLAMDLMNELFARLGLTELTVQIIPPHSSFINALLFLLLVGLFVGLFFGLNLGLSNTQISERLRNKPNQGIQASGRNALGVALISMVLFGLLFGLFSLLFDKPSNIIGSMIAGLLFAGPLVGLLFGLPFGGEMYFRHYILRFILWRREAIPWYYVQFLEEMTMRILLRRVGGGYSFTHRLLLDYFADLDPHTPSSPAGTP